MSDICFTLRSRNWSTRTFPNNNLTQAMENLPFGLTINQKWLEWSLLHPRIFHRRLKSNSYLMSISRRGLVNPSTSRQSLNAPGFKDLPYYALVTRHLFDGYPPLPVAEYTTSDRTKVSIHLFLSQIQKNLLGLVNID